MPNTRANRYVLGEQLSTKTENLVLLTATPHRAIRSISALFLQLLDRDVYGDVKSLEDAMQKNYAPFYLRRIKEDLLSLFLIQKQAWSRNSSQTEKSEQRDST